MFFLMCEHIFIKKWCLKLTEKNRLKHVTPLLNTKLAQSKTDRLQKEIYLYA